MVTAAMAQNLNDLLRRAGAELVVRLSSDQTFWTYEGDFEDARLKLANYDATLTSEHAVLSRKVAEMADEPIDAFWKLTDKALDEHPGLSLSAARFETIARHPDLAQLAAVPGAGRAKRQSKAPPTDSDHYQTLFFSLALKREREVGCTDFEARAWVARSWPSLRTAAFSREPKEKFFSAARYENEQNGLTLDLAYRAVAGFLPLSAMEAL